MLASCSKKKKKGWLFVYFDSKDIRYLAPSWPLPNPTRNQNEQSSPAAGCSSFCKGALIHTSKSEPRFMYLLHGSHMLSSPK